MKNLYRTMYWLATGSLVLTGACLPDNFWADKWGEVLNGGIISTINLILGAISGGNFQI